MDGKLPAWTRLVHSQESSLALRLPADQRLVHEVR